MRRMFRYEVPLDGQPHEVSLANGHRVAVAVNMAGSVEFWSEHDDSAPASIRTFQVFGTGHALPDGAKWVGTCPRVSGLVFHLYELDAARAQITRAIAAAGVTS